MLTIIAVCEKQFFLQVIIKKERQMDLENVISKLNESSKTKYYKFTYQGDGKCKICPQYDGKVFPENKIPQTHPIDYVYQIHKHGPKYRKSEVYPFLDLQTSRPSP